MNNFTIEDYKTAIRAKYKIAIREDVSGVLSDPTPAQLRDFYLRLLERGLSKIDEEIIKMFFEANESLSLKKTIGNCNIGKLKPIISFLEGGNTDNKSRIEMAAILVNFKPRPFRKFQEEEDNFEDDNSNKDSNKSESIIIENESGMEENENKNEANFENIQTAKKTSVYKFPNRFNKKLKLTAAGILIVFCLGFGISYYVFPKEQCMQWSNDHFEKVDCDVKTGKIERFDESKFGLKKIKVYDTTSCFINGEAVVWYAKISSDKADFFNTHGRHPENNKPLRPVTDYIKKRYAEKSVYKK
ncbi:hypothetical protein [Flavobacterium saccharophilum]|uniref:Uncharacterized protein n=1 Tax=Flavobacterium saccharophilum TaxID=29534 RepID=A0A1M7GCE4_9FLAO|nr:hypothetical protein [Flavobacterium saccharophilum]SHM13953.1 hypothetical protein SAMN05444366_2492 [Flavobacterium saccharophilum]